MLNGKKFSIHLTLCLQRLHIIHSNACSQLRISNKDIQTVKAEILSKLRSEHLKKGKARAEKQLQILQPALLKGMHASS